MRLATTPRARTSARTARAPCPRPTAPRKLPLTLLAGCSAGWSRTNAIRSFSPRALVDRISPAVLGPQPTEARQQAIVGVLQQTSHQREALDGARPEFLGEHPQFSSGLADGTGRSASAFRRPPRLICGADSRRIIDGSPRRIRTWRQSADHWVCGPGQGAGRSTTRVRTAASMRRRRVKTGRPVPADFDEVSQSRSARSGSA